MTRRGWALFIAMAVIWGIPYLLIKIAVGQITPPTLVFARTAIGALLLIPLAAARGELAPLLPYWRMLLAYTAAEVALPWVLLSDAERRLPSSLTGLLVAAVPLIGVLLARLTGSDERFGGRRLLGLVIGLAGVAALVGLDVSGSNLRAVDEVGMVALGYAIGPLIIARPLAGVLALVCTAVAFLLFFALIGEVGPVPATVITYFNPAVALLLGIVILNEPFTLGAGAGFVLILLGSFLATRRGPRARVPVVALRD